MKLLFKFYLMIAIPILLCLGIVGSGLSLLVYNYSVSDKHASLAHTAQRISTMASELYVNHAFSREQMVKAVLTSMTSEGKLHIIICDQNGQIVMTSDSYGNGYVGYYVGNDILNETSSSEEFSVIGNLGGLYRGQNYTVGLAARNDIGEVVAYVYVTTSIDNIQALMAYVRNLFITISIIVFIFAAIASYFLVRHTTKPLNQISSAAKRFARGDFKTRVPVHSNDEIGALVVTFNDMADSLEKSEDLRRSFVANVSHELRSPMTSIGGFVDGILDGTIPKEREEHYLSIVSDEVHRLSRLVSRMLEITVLQSKDITVDSIEFDLRDTLRRTLSSFEQRASELNISINTEVPSRPLSVFANEDAIYQVIYNLIDNAVKFSKSDSRIDIYLAEKSGTAVFSVKNYGAEIPKDEIKYVFDRFHKADKSRSKDKGGLGLGLYIAKNIINQHGGNIRAVSENGYTEFSFDIPFKKPVC